MRYVKQFLLVLFFIVPFLFAGNAFAAIFDDEIPEVTARVARISFLRGEAQIRRADSNNWERATQNLPLVEGDEIATGGDARLEIQFNSQKYLRLAENSYLKIVTLKDEGIAVSLPQGTLSLRLLEFDKSRAFFEIDAPQTTVSVQKTGMYRVDAGSDRDKQVRVAVTDLGEARVYSENSGFTLRNGRSARIYLDGNFAGEWETGDAARYADDFDSWALQRDATIAKRLRDAHYDKYYDRDIYGAEDLNEYGEWIYTRKYGYVWRPYRTSTARYADWSPYRYGHWRWVPPFGWTWINDEPWGWATYHHGRWIWDDGGWIWTPYGLYRQRRSWWQPAYVVLTTWNGRVCWFPLPYDYGYYDYNRHYRRGRGNHYYNNTTIINNNTTVVINPPPTQQPPPGTPPVNLPDDNLTNEQRAARLRTPSLQRVPPFAVVGVDASEFGRETKGFRTLPAETAKTFIEKTPDIIQTPPILPEIKDLNGKVSREILIEKPEIIKPNLDVKTGASDRKDGGVSMDDELRKSRIYGNRPPLQQNPDVKIGAEGDENTKTRRTGAVERPVFKSDEQNEPSKSRRDTPPIFSPGFPNPSNDTKTGAPTQRDRDTKTRRDDNDDRKDDRNQSPPIFAPQREEKPRNDPPPRREEKPRYEPPPREEKPRYEPPPREEKPRYEPPPRNDPPPRSEPKEERKPVQPPLAGGKDGKDGRRRK